MNRRSASAILAGGLLAAASLTGLQIAALNVATSAAHSAKSAAFDAARASFILSSSNEAVSDRFQTRAAGDRFFAVVSVRHPHTYQTLSMTYQHLDGSPVLDGGFTLSQADGGLEVVILATTPPGEYKVVIDQLAPSEINHPIIFYVTVTDGEGNH